MPPHEEACDEVFHARVCTGGGAGLPGSGVESIPDRPDAGTANGIRRSSAIDLAISLGLKEPKVAILAAVETVTSKMPATIDAAALCKMAERGQITGGILDVASGEYTG